MDTIFFQNSRWSKFAIFTILIITAFVIGWFLRNSYNNGQSLSTRALRNAKIESFASVSQYYDVKISYPSIEGTTAGKDIATFVTSRLNEFKEDFAKLSAEDIKMMGLGNDPENKWSLNLTATVATSSGYTTFVFEEYTYTGGAHGNTHFYTFTYNNDGKRIQLYDLVGNGEKTGENTGNDEKVSGVTNLNYLKVISSAVRAKLHVSLADSEYTTPDQIDVGTEANEESFKSFYTVDATSTPNKINAVFIFEPYTIGAYVLGSQRVEVDVLK